MKIVVKAKKPKETVEFSDYSTFTAWVISKGENRWIRVSVYFNAFTTKPQIGKDIAIATHLSRSKISIP